MKNQRILVTVLLLLSLPPLVALVEVLTFHVGNRNNGSLLSSGEMREYLLYVPGAYDPTTPTPLVISLHGGANWPVMQRDLSGWNQQAEDHGFLVVYPAGLQVHDAGPRGWRVIREGPGLAKDVRFIADLMDKLEEIYNIDPTRIYVNGLSNGGGMTFVLSCTLSDRIAAVGMVAAAQMLPWSWCTAPRPMPMISFHGTADPIVPYEGGESWASPRPFPDVTEWTAQWARRNRCGPDFVETRAAADVTRRHYTDCAEGAAVLLFTVHGGGHTWPGGGPLPEWFVGLTSHGVDATAEMWEFFHRYRLGKGATDH
jgi:polyhydroxybutyrate depolymerase